MCNYKQFFLFVIYNGATKIRIKKTTAKRCLFYRCCCCCCHSGCTFKIACKLSCNNYWVSWDTNHVQRRRAMCVWAAECVQLPHLPHVQPIKTVHKCQRSVVLLLRGAKMSCLTKWCITRKCKQEQQQQQQKLTATIVQFNCFEIYTATITPCSHRCCCCCCGCTAAPKSRLRETKQAAGNNMHKCTSCA